MTKEEVAAFNAQFRYEKDVIDGWRSLRSASPKRGDCDDYAATVAHIMSGSWPRFWIDLIARKNTFWYCEVGDEGHLMLHRVGVGWIDNIYPLWSQVPKHKPLRRAPAIVVAVKLIRGKLFP